MWKESYDRLERFWTEPLQRVMAAEPFGLAMAATREAALLQQQFSRSILEQAWEQLRLPSTADLARVAGLVVQTEAKVDGLNARLEALEAQLAAGRN